MPIHHAVSQTFEEVEEEHNAYLIDNDIDGILSYYNMERIDLLCHTDIHACEIDSWVEERAYMCKNYWLGIIAPHMSWDNRTFDEATALYDAYTNSLTERDI